MKQVIYTFIICFFALGNAQAQYAFPNSTKPAPGKRLLRQGVCYKNLQFRDSIHRKPTFRKLQPYISKRINWKHLERIRGVIYLEVTVDSNGIPCCIGMTHSTINTATEIEALELPKIINNMPKWRPAIWDNQPVNSMRKIGIYCHVEGRNIFEVKYFNKYKDKKIIITTDDATKLNLDWDEQIEGRKKD